MTSAPTGPAPIGTAPHGSAATDTGRSDVAALAGRVEAATLAVPGVLALHGGAFGEVATFLPGRKVAGVRLDGPDGRHAVHVVVTTTTPVPTTAAAVHAALTAALAGPVDVVVGDVRTPAEQRHVERTQAEQDSSTQEPTGP